MIIEIDDITDISFYTQHSGTTYFCWVSYGRLEVDRVYSSKVYVKPSEEERIFQGAPIDIYFKIRLKMEADAFYKNNQKIVDKIIEREKSNTIKTIDDYSIKYYTYNIKTITND